MWMHEQENNNKFYWKKLKANTGTFKSNRIRMRDADGTQLKRRKRKIKKTEKKTSSRGNIMVSDLWPRWREKGNNFSRLSIEILLHLRCANNNNNNCVSNKRRHNRNNLWSRLALSRRVHFTADDDDVTSKPSRQQQNNAKFVIIFMYVYTFIYGNLIEQPLVPFSAKNAQHT